MRNHIIKEQLAWLRMLFALSAVVDVSLIAWAAQHYASAAAGLLLGAWVLIVAFTAFLAMLTRQKRQFIAAMENES